MKPISVYADEDEYDRLKSLAAQLDRPVAELIREAMSDYLARRSGRGASLLDLPAHPSRRLLRPWSRDELVDEMLAGG